MGVVLVLPPLAAVTVLLFYTGVLVNWFLTAFGYSLICVALYRALLIAYVQVRLTLTDRYDRKRAEHSAGSTGAARP